MSQRLRRKPPTSSGDSSKRRSSRSVKEIFGLLGTQPGGTAGVAPRANYKIAPLERWARNSRMLAARGVLVPRFSGCASGLIRNDST